MAHESAGETPGNPEKERKIGAFFLGLSDVTHSTPTSADTGPAPATSGMGLVSPEPTAPAPISVFAGLVDGAIMYDQKHPGSNTNPFQDALERLVVVDGATQHIPPAPNN